MRSAACLPLGELPDFDEDTGVLHDEDSDDNEDIEIELVEEEPVFLRGFGRSHQELEPVKVVKNPDGSLAQAAMMQGALAKERRETKITQQREKDQSESRPIAEHMLDPMAKSQASMQESGRFAMGGGMGQPNARGAEDMPEWKRHVTAGGKATYGKRTNMSILDQRKSLPIYTLKDQLVKAVLDNQILIVIGETGSGKTTQMTQYMVEAGLAKRWAMSIHSLISLQWQDRLHAAASRRRDERGEARRRGVRLPAGLGGRLHDPLRGLHQPGDDHQVHDGRWAVKMSTFAFRLQACCCASA